MDATVMLSLGKEALLLVVLLSLPPILASLVVGVGASLLQTVTQVQDASLSAVPKLCAAIGALVLIGPWMAGELSRFAHLVLLMLAPGGGRP